FQVIGELDVLIAFETGDLSPLAVRACATPDLELPVGWQFPRFPPLGVQQTGSSDRLASAEVNLLALVVEERTAVDVLELLKCESRPAPFLANHRGEDLVRPGYLVACRVVVYTFLTPPSRRFGDDLDELRNLPQGGTVLGVVGQELILP